jgi:GNAT superfamily N-acetyltransferase
MTFTYHKVRGEDDYYRARDFLRECYLLNGRREFCWQPYRLDYARWHGLLNISEMRYEDVMFIWEADGQIAGVLNAEDKRNAFLQVHPQHQDASLYEVMIDVAEREFAWKGDNGQQRLCLWAGAHNTLLQGLLAQRDYTKGDWPESQRYQSLAGKPMPNAPSVPGYTIRSLGDGVELIERCYASGLAFHEGDIKVAAGNREVSWYRNIQKCILYRRDLDLVAVTDQGEVASFCTIWYDDVTRTGAFEPVATVPAHQRHGLARAVMTEGIRRLLTLGAVHASVGSYSDEAGALYAAMGFTQYDMSGRWEKTLV